MQEKKKSSVLRTRRLSGKVLTFLLGARLCENYETFETVEKGHHVHSKINHSIPKSVSFTLQSRTT